MNLQVFPPTAEAPIERILVRARVGPHPHMPGRSVVMAKTVALPDLPGGGVVVLLDRESDALEAYSFGGELLVRDENPDLSGSFVLSTTFWDDILYVLLCRPGRCLLVRFSRGSDSQMWLIIYPILSFDGYDSGVVLPPTPGQNVNIFSDIYTPRGFVGAVMMEAFVPVKFRPAYGVVAFLLKSDSGELDVWRNGYLEAVVKRTSSAAASPRLIPSGLRLVGGLTDNHGHTLAFARGEELAGSFRMGLTLASLELVDLSPTPDPSYDSQERRAGVVDKHFPDGYWQPKSVGWRVGNSVGQSIRVSITLRALEKFWAYGVLWASDGSPNYKPSDVTTSLSPEIREELPYQEASYGSNWGCVFFPAPILVYPGQVFTVTADKVMGAWNEDWLFAGEVGLVGFPAGQIGGLSVLTPQE